MKNRFEMRGGVAVILVPRRNGNALECLIDTADLPIVEQAPGYWYARHRPACRTYYVFADFRVSGRRKTIGLHRLLLCAPDHLQVDHINHNGLDNQRTNIRLATWSQNQHNRRGASAMNQNSGVRNVYWDRRMRKWRVCCKVRGQRIDYGAYDAKTDAENAAARMRAEMMEFSFEARAIFAAP